MEDALHRLGWLLVDVSSLDAPDAPGAAATLLQGVFAEAARTFALPESDLAELTQQNNERTGCQALSYLPLGSEPLYAEGQAQQVRRAPAEKQSVSQSVITTLLPTAAEKLLRAIFPHPQFIYLNAGALTQRPAASHRG